MQKCVIIINVKMSFGMKKKQQVTELRSSDKKTMTNRKIKLSKISIFHYSRLVFRSVLFLLAVLVFIVGWGNHRGVIIEELKQYTFLLMFIWIVFAAEMISRFFPSPFESMGCQKQFAKNYVSSGRETQLDDYKVSWKVTFAMTAAWFALNGAIGCLYLLGVIDQGIMLLVSLAYSVCDMICILFFCPFQSWFMKNKCCGSCRIYNWDYAMMFTPLVFVPSVYTWSLLGLSLLLLARWEITYRLYPERFYEATNKSLECANCKEKLCHHKKQLRRLWERIEMKKRTNAD